MADPIPATAETRVSDVALSFIRTWTPYLVTGALAWGGRRYGIVLPETLSTELTLTVAVGAGSAYYAAARWLERRTGPSRWRTAARTIGRWMLAGVIRQPIYTNPPVDQAAIIEPDGDVHRPE